MMNCTSPVRSGTETVVRNSSRKVALTSSLFAIEEPSTWRGRVSEAQLLKSQYPHQIPSFLIPYKQFACTTTGAQGRFPERDIHHDSGTGDDQAIDGYHARILGNRPFDNVRRRCTVWRSIRQVGGCILTYLHIISS